ncbi:VOC family protein [Novosphingobium sp.]|uniref:VOC family protein n=1 Tax=Novosphingobium sp. TaxID=1874826 RepID=UPI00286D108B|nr:VOC family protein [Novosphingobium sp.]
MLRITGIEHVQLAMPPGGEDAARGFYADLLGIAEVPKPPVLAARGGCWFESESVKLHLGVEADFRPAKKAHPALLVDDLAGMLEALEAAGVAVAPDDPVDGRARCYVSDPFGNRIELMQA